MSTRPLPTPDAETGPFWAAAREKRFALQRCQSCEKAVFYPRLVCPHCGSDRLAWTDASGAGVIYSVTVVERAPGAFRDLAPYAVALIDLDEGPRVMSRILTDSPETLTIGQRVAVRFEEMSEDVTLPLFAPASE